MLDVIRLGLLMRARKTDSGRHGTHTHTLTVPIITRKQLRECADNIRVFVFALLFGKYICLRFIAIGQQHREITIRTNSDTHAHARTPAHTEGWVGRWLRQCIIRAYEICIS